MMKDKDTFLEANEEEKNWLKNTEMAVKPQEDTSVIDEDRKVKKTPTSGKMKITIHKE